MTIFGGLCWVSRPVRFQGVIKFVIVLDRCPFRFVPPGIQEHQLSKNLVMFEVIDKMKVKVVCHQIGVHYVHAIDKNYPCFAKAIRGTLSEETQLDTAGQVGGGKEVDGVTYLLVKLARDLTWVFTPNDGLVREIPLFHSGKPRFVKYYYILARHLRLIP